VIEEGFREQGESGSSLVATPENGRGADQSAGTSWRSSRKSRGEEEQVVEDECKGDVL